MKKLVLIFLALIVTGFLGFQIYSRTGDRNPGPSAAGFPGGRQAAAVAVEVAEVRRAALREVGTFAGSLQPRSRFTVATTLGGRLEKLYVDVGDAVANGQVVAELAGQEYAQQVETARAELTVAEANLEDSRIALEAARRDLERVSALREKLIASAAEHEAAIDQLSKMEARYRLVQAQLQQRRGALELARDRLSDTRIEVAWEGGGGRRVIGERFVDQGALLRANDPIVSVLDIETLLAVINVTEAGYARVQVGQRAVVTADALPGERFEGRVARIAPFLQESSRQAEVRIEIPNPRAALKPGMFARVEIEFGVRQDVPTVPAAALVNHRDRRGVFVIDEKLLQARFVEVTTGIAEGDRVEVVEPALSGLVVTLGQHLLQEGSPVLLPEAYRAQPVEANRTQPADAGGRTAIDGRTAADGRAAVDGRAAADGRAALDGRRTGGAR